MRRTWSPHAGRLQSKLSLHNRARSQMLQGLARLHWGRSVEDTSSQSHSRGTHRTAAAPARKWRIQPANTWQRRKRRNLGSCLRSCPWPSHTRSRRFEFPLSRDLAAYAHAWSRSSYGVGAVAKKPLLPRQHRPLLPSQSPVQSHLQQTSFQYRRPPLPFALERNRFDFLHPRTEKWQLRTEK